MKRIFIPLLTLLTQITALASTSLATLNVDGDVALFTTAEAKTHEIPSCVDQSRKQEWAVSLDTASGKAIYSLLIAAMSGNRAITVESSLDCAGVGSVERAHKVTVDASKQETLPTGIYLYKADAKTKVGRVFDQYRLDQFYYIPVDEAGHSVGVRALHYYNHDNGKPIYYRSADCTGEPLVQLAESSVFRNIGYDNGAFHLVGKQSSSYISTKSVMRTNGECGSHSTSRRYNEVLQKAEHPLCGENLCVIKEG
ncbi:MAG: hypothetical protein MK214_15665 [Thalassotalea sp.]|nr:hypothetical protein [Thalassotalea sp.]